MPESLTREKTSLIAGSGGFTSVEPAGQKRNLQGNRFGVIARLRAVV
jgi:hypothetical protein